MAFDSHPFYFSWAIVTFFIILVYARSKKDREE